MVRHASLHNAHSGLQFIRLLAAFCGVMLTCACTLDDPRDLCCPDSSAMLYTYRPYGTEAFTEYISSLRHFLYDSEGYYISEVPPGEDLQYQALDLPEGSYTMITIGNCGAATSLNHSTAAGLHDFALSCTDDTADELYWGVSRFAIDSHGLATDLTPDRALPGYSRLTTPMNNIHCHLTIRVEWANLPERIGTYEIELSGVPGRYNLHPDLAGCAGGFTVPLHDTLTVHRQRVPMDALELNTEFITLRYTDESIPTLRLWFDGHRMGPDIDLARAFRTWGWYPSRVHVQKYTVNIRIYGDGRAEVSPHIGASVDDWIDGGTFG